MDYAALACAHPASNGDNECTNAVIRLFVIEFVEGLIAKRPGGAVTLRMAFEPPEARTALCRERGRQQGEDGQDHPNEGQAKDE